MPHQCVRCNSLYPNGAKEILTGCTCGARLFFYIKQKHLEEGKELVSKLSKEEKKNIEKDIVEIINIKEDDNTKPIILDIEAIRVMKPGKYELDLVHLFKKDPLIIKLEEGKYMVDIGEAFKNDMQE
jgi:hypothetical protein